MKFQNLDGTFVEINRNQDYMASGDPRIAHNQFGSAIGLYSNVAEFMGLVSELTTFLPNIGITASNAGLVANLLSMYNASTTDFRAIVGTLTSAEQTQVNQGDFTPIVIKLRGLDNIPRFLEVVTNVPMFGPPGSLTGLFVEFSK